MNKKAYIRTLESIIAIMIILVFIFTVLQPRYKREREPAEIELLQDTIINELEENNNYRNYILSNDEIGLIEINNFINNIISKIGKYNFYLHTQPVSDPLSIPTTLPTDKKIYARGIIISATLEQYAPKIVVLYIWEE